MSTRKPESHRVPQKRAVSAVPRVVQGRFRACFGGEVTDELRARVVVAVERVVLVPRELRLTEPAVPLHVARARVPSDSPTSLHVIVEIAVNDKGRPVLARVPPPTGQRHGVRPSGHGIDVAPLAVLCGRHRAQLAPHGSRRRGGQRRRSGWRGRWWKWRRVRKVSLCKRHEQKGRSYHVARVLVGPARVLLVVQVKARPPHAHVTAPAVAGALGRGVHSRGLDVRVDKRVKVAQTQDQPGVVVKRAPQLRVQRRARAEKQPALAQARRGRVFRLVLAVDEPEPVRRQQRVCAHNLVALLERDVARHVQRHEHARVHGGAGKAREATRRLRVSRVQEGFAAEPRTAQQVLCVARHHLVAHRRAAALEGAHAAGHRSLPNHLAGRVQDGQLRHGAVDARPPAVLLEPAVQMKEAVRFAVRSFGPVVESCGRPHAVAHVAGRRRCGRHRWQRRHPRRRRKRRCRRVRWGREVVRQIQQIERFDHAVCNRAVRVCVARGGALQVNGPRRVARVLRKEHRSILQNRARPNGHAVAHGKRRQGWVGLLAVHDRARRSARHSCAKLRAVNARSAGCRRLVDDRGVVRQQQKIRRGARAHVLIIIVDDRCNVLALGQSRWVRACALAQARRQVAHVGLAQHIRGCVGSEHVRVDSVPGLERPFEEHRGLLRFNEEVFPFHTAEGVEVDKPPVVQSSVVHARSDVVIDQRGRGQECGNGNVVGRGL